MPIAKGVGDQVHAGSINANGMSRAQGRCEIEPEGVYRGRLPLKSTCEPIIARAANWG
jgi:hypothetical protein